MVFELTREQRLLQLTIREFAEAELRPGAAERERTGEFPREVIKKLGRMGIFGLIFPKQYGGQERDFSDYAVVVEELARHDASVALSYIAHMLCAYHLNSFGNIRQKEQYLVPLLCGEKLGGWAFAESSAKGGAGRIATSAILRSGAWLLSGNKSHVTNGSVADTIVVMATTAGRVQSGDFSAFIVPGDASGLDRVEGPGKHGFHSSDTVSLVLRDLRIPLDNLLGNENQGLIQTTEVCAISRIGVAAMAVGIGRGSLERDIVSVQGHTPFGRLSAGFQTIEWTLGSQRARAKKQIISQREKQVLGWLKLGKSSWDISVILGISERTVYFHVSNIMKKLGASNRAQAVAVATRLGLVDNC